MRRKDYNNLKIEIDLVSGKIFSSSRGRKPSSTKSANSKNLQLFREILQPKSAKNDSKLHPKSLSITNKRDGAVKERKIGIKRKKKLSAHSLSKSYRKNSNFLLKRRKMTSNSKKKFKDRYYNFNDQKKPKSQSGSRKRKENYLTGNMANVKKRPKNKFFDRRKKSDWISDAYISKFSKTRREALKKGMLNYGIKSVRDWRNRDRSYQKKTKGKEGESRG